MTTFGRITGTGLFAATLSVCSLAQATLPVTAPTAVSASQMPSANPPVEHRGNPLRVEWDGHLLQIAADGQTLQETLRTVAQQTGMRLTGNPPDDRVFGNYGPAPLVEILPELVDGLAVNMIFVDRTGTAPAELAFTPRNGAPSPPSEYPQTPVQTSQQAVYPPRPSRPPVNPQPGFGGAPAGQAIRGGDGGTPTADNANGNAGANPVSTNGARTPQEIFEQLQRMRAAAAANRQQQ